MRYRGVLRVSEDLRCNTGGAMGSQEDAADFQRVSGVF